MTASRRSFVKVRRISSQLNVGLRRYIVGDNNLGITMCPQKAGGTPRRDRAVQDATDDGALPGAVAVKPQLPRGQTFFHSDGDRSARNRRDLATDGDAIDRAGFTSQAQDPGR